MKNLLPPISEKIRSREDTSIANWNPAQADPKTATISKCLQSEFTVRYEELKKFKENVLGKSAPNYVRPEVLRSIGPSPISEEARGEYEDPLIDFKPPVNNSIKARMARAAALESSYHLVVKLQSRMPVAMDLFIQGKNSILTTQLFPFRDFLRYVSLSSVLFRLLIVNDLLYSSYRELGGSGAGADYASNPKNLLNVYFTTQTLSTVTTTSRQEIRDFKFRSDERIGMEVEYLNDRVSCLLS